MGLLSPLYGQHPGHYTPHFHRPRAYASEENTIYAPKLYTYIGNCNFCYSAGGGKPHRNLYITAERTMVLITHTDIIFSDF